MKSHKKLTTERLMQAKAFLDNGVITRSTIEMTHGQAEPDVAEESQVLGMILIESIRLNKDCWGSSRR